MLPRAYIVHRLRGRLRLRIREQPEDPDYFHTLNGRLESISGVSEVRCRESTGSILLHHPELSYAELAPRLQELQLFELVDGPEPQRAALNPLREGASWMSRLLSEDSRGIFDLNTLAFISLVGLAARQIYRGQIVGPAVPMLLSALQLARQIGQTVDTSDTDD